MSARRITRNILLDGLPDDAWKRLAPRLEAVAMPAGQLLSAAGTVMRDGYFPTSSIVCKLYSMGSGTSAEIALIGREGMVGVSLFLGGHAWLSEARVQRGGTGLKLAAQDLRDEFERRGAMMRVLLRHTLALMAQVTQTAACNRHGTLEQRLCRWLLMSLDRSPGDELKMTHESIANMLGVRREGVTEAAGRLQQQGLIRYRRGHIAVLDRSALESRVREWYTCVLHDETDWLPPGHGPL